MPSRVPGWRRGQRRAGTGGEREADDGQKVKSRRIGPPALRTETAGFLAEVRGAASISPHFAYNAAIATSAIASLRMVRPPSVTSGTGRQPGDLLWRPAPFRANQQTRLSRRRTVEVA